MRIGVAVVAVRARPAGLAERIAGRVAGLAAQRRVQAFEREVGDGVVERGAIEPEDVRVAPFVLAVATAALGLRGDGMPAVVAASLPLVGGDGVVAVETQSALRLCMERFVTLAALRFDLGVPRDDRARHHERLQHAAPCERGREEYERRDRESSQHFHRQYRCTATTWIAAAPKSRTQRGTWMACQRERTRS